jgi:hypothetical protein
MNGQRRISSWLILSAILSSVFFYIVLFSLSKWFPGWTGRTLQNEWVLVVVSAIPVFVVLIFLIIDRMTKAKFGDLEFEFGEAIPPNLIDPGGFEPSLFTRYITKQGQLDLPRLIEEIQRLNQQPRILLVLLDRQGRNIRFPILREYIYELSKVSLAQYIVFLNEENRYLAFMTVEGFQKRFPKFGIEVLFDDLQNPRYERRIVRADLPILHNENESERYRELIRDLVRMQWGAENNAGRVSINDLGRLGASELKAYSSWSVESIYSILVREDISGIPIVDKDMFFIGIATQDKIARAVILRLLEKTSSREKKS